MHCDAVEEALARLNFRETFRLDAEHAFEETAITIEPAAGVFRWEMRRRDHPSQGADSGSVRRVYFRRWGSTTHARELTFPDSAHLDQAESLGACRRLIGNLPPDLFPLGHPRAMDAAENKLRQLNAARRVGLDIPETIYSTDAGALAEFAARHESVAVKPLSQPGVNFLDESKPDGLLWCRAYPGAELARTIRATGRTQLYLQENIVKLRDLRILLLPRQVFACEIDTSSLPPGEPDWRRVTGALPHRMIGLDAPFERQLRDFLREMGIVSGSFDFALTNNGRRVFFECNPNGQWLWVEKLAGAPIAEAVANELVAGLESGSADI